MRSSQSFHACADTFSKIRWPELARPRWRFESRQLLLELHALHGPAALVAKTLDSRVGGSTFVHDTDGNSKVRYRPSSPVSRFPITRISRLSSRDTYGAEGVQVAHLALSASAS